MPFCSSCGREIDPDQNFCEYCGAPRSSAAETPASLASPPPPPPPVVLQQTTPAATPPPPPPVRPVIAGEKMPLAKNTRIAVGIVAVLVVIALVYTYALPAIKGTPISGSGTTPSPSPVVTTVKPTTTTVTTTTAPTLIQRQELRYDETYNLIYESNLSYKFGQMESFTHKLERPPLFVKFSIIPAMIAREKVVDVGPSVTAVYVSPDSWFEVKVLDADTNNVVDKRGFNKDYSVMSKQEFMVRNKGNYRVEMSGHNVTAEVLILTGSS